MKINLFYLLIIFIILNIRSYWLMIKDKKRAIHNSENGLGGSGRIPEKSLISAAFLYGFLGIALGMFPPLRHKKNKPKFKIGIPLVTIIVSAGTYFILDFLHSSSFCDIYYDAGVLFN